MAWRIVRQPDGKLARFSDIVDDFTHMGMTESEALSVCREEGLRGPEAVAKVRAGIDDEFRHGEARAEERVGRGGGKKRRKKA